jgi:hypothetical protein
MTTNTEEQPYRRCMRVTRKGEPCGNKAAIRTDYCLVHNFSGKRGSGWYIGLAGMLLGLASFIFFFYPPIPPSSLTKAQNQAVSRDTIWDNAFNKRPAPELTNGIPVQTDSGTSVICQAWPIPIFNPYPVNYSDSDRLFCHDKPLIDVVKDVPDPRWAQSEEEYYATRHFNVGDVIVVGLSMNNGGINEPNYMIRNVDITTAIKQANGIYIISAVYSGENVGPRAGNVYVDVGPSANLEIIPSSGYMYDFQGHVILDQQNIELANTTLRLGDFDPGFENGLLFTFKLRVVSKT